MSRSRRRLGRLLGLGLGLGPGLAGAGLAERLDGEIAALGAHVESGPPAGLWLGLLAIAVAGVATDRLLLARFARPFGLSRPVARWLSSLVALSLASGLVFRTAFEIAPLLVSLALTLGVAGLVFATARAFGRWAAGSLLILRGRMRIGDRVRVAELEGTVESIGLLRVVALSDAGQRFFLPIGSLSTRDLGLSSPRRAHPVSFELELRSPLGPEQRAELVQLATLCPFRDVDSEVTISPVAGPPRRVVIRFRAWSRAGAARAVEYLEAHLNGASPADPRRPKTYVPPPLDSYELE